MPRRGPPRPGVGARRARSWARFVRACGGRPDYIGSGAPSRHPPAAPPARRAASGGGQLGGAPPAALVSVSWRCPRCLVAPPSAIAAAPRPRAWLSRRPRLWCRWLGAPPLRLRPGLRGLVAAGGPVATACGVLVVLPRSSCARLGRSVAAPPPVWSGGWVWWWSVAGRRGAPPWGALLAPRGGGCRRGCCGVRCSVLRYGSPPTAPRGASPRARPSAARQADARGRGLGA